MRRWCLAVIAFGLMLAGAAAPPVDGPALMLLRLFGGHAPVVTPELRFAVGLMGAVTMGWGGSLLAVAAGSADLAPDVRVTLWRRIGWAVLGWYVLDGAISVATGFWPNAVSNTALLAWFLAVRPR